MSTQNTIQLPPSERHRHAELRLLELLDQAELPHPDEIRYTEGELHALWHERKVCVVIDLATGMPT